MTTADVLYEELKPLNGVYPHLVVSVEFKDSMQERTSILDRWKEKLSTTSNFVHVAL